MQENMLRIYKKRIIGAIVIAVFLIIATVLFLQRPGSVVISTEEGAAIETSLSQGGEFTKLGTTTAKYSTRKFPTTVYIKVTSGNKETISGIELERGKKKTLHLSLSNRVAATAFTEGGYSNAFIQGDQGMGIIPDEYILSNFKLNQTKTDPRIELINLPYVKKIVYYDWNNFIYAKFNGGIGGFTNGELTYERDIALILRGKDIDDIDAEMLYEKIQDISKFGNRPLALLSDTNLFTSDDRGVTLTSIASFEPDSTVTNKVFTTGSHIYRAEIQDPASYEEDQGTGQSTLFVYDYAGKELSQHTIESNDIKSIVEKDNKTYILTNDKVAILSNGKLHDLNLYFRYARDITVYKNKVVMLGDSGVWRLDDDGVSLQLLYDFSKNGVGLAQSFSAVDGKLLFATQQSVDNTEVIPYTFTLDL